MTPAPKTGTAAGQIRQAPSPPETLMAVATATAKHENHQEKRFQEETTYMSVLVQIACVTLLFSGLVGSLWEISSRILSGMD